MFIGIIFNTSQTTRFSSEILPEGYHPYTVLKYFFILYCVYYLWPLENQKSTAETLSVQDPAVKDAHAVFATQQATEEIKGRRFLLMEDSLS